VELVGIAAHLLAKRTLQGFDCDIEPDLVPELKTVGDGLRGWINADGNPIDLMVFDSFRQRRAG
jgi:hypothetical protein